MPTLSSVAMFGESNAWLAITEFFAKAIEWLFGLTKSIGIPSYILAILLFTIIIKILLQPLMNKQLRSSRKMQLLQPEIDEIKRRYSNNPQRQQQETMKFYKDNGASPTAGCLPLLIQLPILYAMFYAMRNFGGVGSLHPYYPEFFSFLCWDNLAEIVKNAPLPWVLPIIAAGATFLQQWLTMTNKQDRQQIVMLIVFPLMFLFFVRNFPVLMAFYWVFYSLIGAIITYPLLRHWKKVDTAAIEAARRAKEEEAERKKANRKAAKELYYNGKLRKEQDKNGNRGHYEEVAEEEPVELSPEQQQEKEFKNWLLENGYNVGKKRMRLHPYSVEPEVVLIATDEKGVEQDIDKLRQEYLNEQNGGADMPAPPTSLKEMFGMGKKKGTPAPAAAEEAAEIETEAVADAEEFTAEGEEAAEKNEEA